MSQHKLTYFPLLLIVCLSLIFSLLRLNAISVTYVDDAFIFMRFAENLVNGWGFVWNPGEMHVEGFSSFLYVILLATIKFLGFSLPNVVIWVGILFSFLTLIITYKIAFLVFQQQRFWVFLFIGFLGISPVFLTWTLSGMETLLFTTLILLAVLGYLYYSQGVLAGWVVGIIFGLATLTRPETIAYWLWVLIFDAVSRIFRKEKVFTPGWIQMGAAFLILLIPFFLWRWIYFGQLLPNTYYAKSGAGLIQYWGGFLYLLKSVRDIFGTLGWLLLGLLFFTRWNAPERNPLVFLGSMVVLSWGIALVEGGDHFKNARFLLPVLPLLFIILAAGLVDFLERISIKDSNWRVNLSLAFFLSLLLLFSWSSSLQYKQISTGISNFQNSKSPTIPIADEEQFETLQEWSLGYVLMGQALQKFAQSDELIAAVPVGAIGYYSGMRVIDMVGLVDPVIALEPFDLEYIATWRPGHDKGNGEYIFSQQPDYIQFVDYLTSEPFEGLDAQAQQYKSIVEIWGLQSFHENYTFFPVRIEGGWYYNLYRRNK